MKQNLVTGYCLDTYCVSKNTRAAIYWYTSTLYIDIVKLKEKIMSLANCSCKISMCTKTKHKLSSFIKQWYVGLSKIAKIYYLAYGIMHCFLLLIRMNEALMNTEQLYKRICTLIITFSFVLFFWKTCFIWAVGMVTVRFACESFRLLSVRLRLESFRLRVM